MGKDRRAKGKFVGKAQREIARETIDSRTDLDPIDHERFREQAHRMLDDMLGHLETIRERPLWQPIPDEVRNRFRQELPTKPSSLADVHEQFMTSILPFTANNAHPGFMGWVQGGGTFVGMMAEMLAAGLNANVGGRDQIPLEVERQVTAWMRSVFGFPDSASGLFVTGTSMANFIAAIVARDAVLGKEVRQSGVARCSRRLTAYASTAAHGCIARALDFAGLGSDCLRMIPVDERQRIDLGALAKAISTDRADGFTPFLVVGNAGTVDTGAIDNLSDLAELCASEHLWFHVDGAFGALAMLSSELAPRLRGIERADSLAFDFHKWGQVQYDAGYILVRDGALHQQAFAHSSAYLTRDDRGMSAGSPWPCDFGPDLSRGFRALKTWATLKTYGTDAIGATILHTCELARYLQSRIANEEELELLAPVELNIVCFRFRFTCSGAQLPTEEINGLTRQIVIQLQEAGAVAPSTTMLQGTLAIRAAIVNHRTTEKEIDTLVESTLKAGRALRPAPAQSDQQQSEHDAMLRQLNELIRRCENSGQEIELLSKGRRSAQDKDRPREFEFKLKASRDKQRKAQMDLLLKRAIVLAQMDRNSEAQADHLRVIELDSKHLPNLVAFGRLLTAMGQNKAAVRVYAQALEHHPEDIVCRVNLGALLLHGEDFAGARLQYEAALHIDPEFLQAHGGMYYALMGLGEYEAAYAHRSKAMAKQCIFRSPFRGDAEPIPILLLVSSTGGNTPIEKLLDERIFQTYVIVADFYDGKTPLPEHHLIVNGIGDNDAAAEALIAADSILSQSSAPVLNRPAAVRETGRCLNANRLGSIPGVLSPSIATFPYSVLASTEGSDALDRAGFKFPLLLRAPGFHMGKHFVRVESAAQLSDAIATLPGADRADSELLAIEYLDARGADGNARKYRVMMVGGELFPLHLAISPDWKIHYFSADMKDRPDHRAEEQKFLTDMPGVLGTRAMDGLKQVQHILGLDYGGIDFGINQSGEILLFEANATMVVEQPVADPKWDYRRAAVSRIHEAFRRMLLSNTSTRT